MGDCPGPNKVVVLIRLLNPLLPLLFSQLNELALVSTADLNSRKTTHKAALKADRGGFLTKCGNKSRALFQALP